MITRRGPMGIIQCVQKQSLHLRHHLVLSIPIYGTNVSKMELLRPSSSTIYNCGHYSLQWVKPSCASVTHRIPQLLTISESSSVSNQVLVPGRHFWVTSIWQPPLQFYTNNTCISYNSDHQNLSFYHNYYTTAPGYSPIAPHHEIYYNFFSNINITDITDEAQGKKVAPALR